MKYIDFGEQVKEKPDYTKGYWDGMASVLFDLKVDSEFHAIAKGIIESNHSRYRKNPHYHYSSIIGPYCVACHCNLPGPNGEWE